MRTIRLLKKEEEKNSESEREYQTFFFFFPKPKKISQSETPKHSLGMLKKNEEKKK